MKTCHPHLPRAKGTQLQPTPDPHLCNGDRSCSPKDAIKYVTFNDLSYTTLLSCLKSFGSLLLLRIKSRLLTLPLKILPLAEASQLQQAPPEKGLHWPLFLVFGIVYFYLFYLKFKKKNYGAGTMAEQLRVLAVYPEGLGLMAPGSPQL